MRRRGEQPWRTERARTLRDRQTAAEEVLWSKLRAKRLSELQFVRQLAIGPHFADFACRRHRVVIEVDGGTHSTPIEIEADRMKAARMEADGYRVFRVHNSEIYENVDGVLDTLLAFIDDNVARTSTRLPLSPTLSTSLNSDGERGN